MTQPTVELDLFRGPVDLLLTLVQSEEISLLRVRLVEVIDQIVRQLEADKDLDESGNVLLVLSSLLELKSKLLLPGKVDIQKEIDSLKDDLLEKLMVHRRLSQVLDSLDNRFRRRLAMYSRPGLSLEREEIIIPLGQQDPEVLHVLIQPLRETARRDTFRVDYEILPVEHYYEWIRREAGGRDFGFLELARKRKDILDLTGVIIALLEMVRLKQLTMDCEGIGGDTGFHWREPGEEDPPDDGAPPVDAPPVAAQ